MTKKLDPVSPGEMLLEEFLKPLGMSNYRLAKEINVPAQRIGEIIAGRRAITADTDLRLCLIASVERGLIGAVGIVQRLLGDNTLFLHLELAIVGFLI